MKSITQKTTHLSVYGDGSKEVLLSIRCYEVFFYIPLILYIAFLLVYDEACKLL